MDEELDRILKKTEILERLKKLAEGDWKDKLQPSIDALIKELEREVKGLATPTGGSAPSGATPGAGGEKTEASRKHPLPKARGSQARTRSTSSRTATIRGRSRRSYSRRRPERSLTTPRSRRP